MMPSYYRSALHSTAAARTLTFALTGPLAPSTLPANDQQPAQAKAYGGLLVPRGRRAQAACRVSIDLDATHAQTILAYDLNDKPLPVSNGAPLRCRVERQLGYKQAK